MSSGGWGTGLWVKSNRKGKRSLFSFRFLCPIPFLVTEKPPSRCQVSVERDIRKDQRSHEGARPQVGAGSDTSSSSTAASGLLLGVSFREFLQSLVSNT